MIFVFGSNENGIHGAGAAKFAHLNYGAVYGVGYGHQGDSFAIPTKDWEIVSLKLETIKHYVDGFMRYARMREDLDFKITRIGCGLAGFKDSDIAPMFENAPANCVFDTEWLQYLKTPRRTWGSA